MKSIIIILVVFLFFIISCPIFVVEWILSKFHPYAADISQLRIVQFMFHLINKIAGVKVTVIGEENVPKNEAVLYICNHRGFFDTVTTYARCPGLTGYVSKIGIKKVPFLSLWMKRLHCLFIDRDDIKQSLTVILQAIEHIKKGISVCIFPEGTRSKDVEHPENLNPFKDGSFKIAQKTGCKIIPIAIMGTDDALENHFPWIRRANVTLVYGKPIQLSELPKEDQKKPGAYFQNLISTMIIEQKERKC